MNNKGQSLGLGIISAIMLFIIGFGVVNILEPEIVNARTDLLCSSPASISDGIKLLCLVIDTQVSLYILAILSISGGAIISKFNIK